MSHKSASVLEQEIHNSEKVIKEESKGQEESYSEDASEPDL